VSNVLASPKSKFVLTVVLAGAAIGLLVFQFRRPAVLPSKIPFVCVATGERFRLDRDAVVTVPTPNPKTQQRTLLPCYEENGVWKVDEHYRGSVQTLAEQNHYVDGETLVVRGTP